MLWESGIAVSAEVALAPRFTHRMCGARREEAMAQAQKLVRSVALGQITCVRWSRQTRLSDRIALDARLTGTQKNGENESKVRGLSATDANVEKTTE